METNHYKTTAYAIRIGDKWFAGFGGKPGQEGLTKVRPGLCDAKLVWDDRKAAVYVERLRVRDIRFNISALMCCRGMSI